MKNLEFKVQIFNCEAYERKLQTLNPKSLGTEKQLDTYFNVEKGRLKLRESGKKSRLINYVRAEDAGIKIAQIMLYEHEPNIMLKRILTEQLGIKVIVNKERKKYSCGSVVFHFDVVDELGSFLEVEVSDIDNHFSIKKMQQIIDKYVQFFDLKKDQLIKASYSDLLIDKK